MGVRDRICVRVLFCSWWKGGLGVDKIREKLSFRWQDIGKQFPSASNNGIVHFPDVSSDVTDSLMASSLKKLKSSNTKEARISVFI